MQSIIKVIVALKIATFFFPLYSMEPQPENFYCLEIRELQNKNPLLGINNFRHFNSQSGCSTDYVSENDLIRENEALLLALTAAKLILENDETKSKKIFKQIYNAACEGVSIISEHDFADIGPTDFVVICPSQHPILAFDLAKNLLENPPHCLKNRSTRLIRCFKKNTWMKNISDGEKTRQATIAFMLDDPKTYALGGLKIDIPKDVILLMLSFLPKYNNDEKRRAFFKKAGQAF